MKRLRTSFLATLGAAALASSLLAAAPATGAEQAPTDWTLTEDVDLSDASRWSLETGQAANTSSYDRPENVSFGDDGLIVSGKRENWSGRSLTSGDAKGTDIVIPNYARVEAVGNASYGEGLWPALMWLRPLDSPHGEIDLMEVFSTADRVTTTIHSEYGPTHRQRQGNAKWADLVESDPEADHTYVMEKTPDRITISVDGIVMLDATPETVPTGFDWDGVFERPGATWYPRVTLQIGCPTGEPDCGLGLPEPEWTDATVQLKSLKIWEWTPGEGPAPVAPPVPAPTPAPEVDPSPVPGAPTPGEGAEPIVEGGSFDLARGQELRHSLSRTEQPTDAGGVTFTVPESLGTATLYGSIQVRSSENGRSGYRGTVAIRPNGSLFLTTEKLQDGKRTLLDQRTVAARGSVDSGDDVRVEISYVDGAVQAKTWTLGDGEPDAWQLTAEATGAELSDAGVQILGYLSRSAKAPVTAIWSDLTPMI